MDLAALYGQENAALVQVFMKQVQLATSFPHDMHDGAKTLSIIVTMQLAPGSIVLDYYNA